MHDLKNKVILITGASSGIGAATAMSFGAWGARVAVHYNSREAEAKSVMTKVRQAGGEGFMFRADVSMTSQLDQLAAEVYEHFGRIDVLVNNAGGFVKRSALVDANDELIDQVFHLNARSMLALSRAVIPLMRKQGGGSIINVTSQAARTGGSFGSGLYASSKGYLTTLTRALAKEVVTEGIRVNAVAPGVISTPLHDGHTDAALMEKLRAGIPMGRLGRADECAGAILFLASEALSSYVTGQIIEVNGGSVMP